MFKGPLALSALASLAIGGLAEAQTLPKTPLTVVGNISITTQSKELEIPFWSEGLSKASGGAVTATIKPWDQMGLKGPEVLKLLRQGLFDVATAQLGHSAGETPINDATDLAGLATTIEEFKAVTHAFRPTLEEYYEKNLGLKILGLWSFQAQVLYCKTELKGLADLKGRKVRTSGASQSDFLEYFGASGVNMNFGEVQTALQTGVIDCAVTGTLGGYRAKWHEAANYLYSMGVNWGAGVNAINLKKWNSLDPGVQKLILAEVKKLEAEIWDQNKRENDIGLACNTGTAPCPVGPPASMKLVKATDGDLELRRKALVEVVLPRWAKRCGEVCVKQWNDTIGKTAGLTATIK